MATKTTRIETTVPATLGEVSCMPIADVGSDRFPAHLWADLVPLMKAEEFGALREDVRARGIEKPIVLWKDSKGRDWLLDGRNRRMAGEKVMETGGMADGSSLMVPVQWIEAGDHEALMFVMRTNVNRRQLESGQRAAVCVLAELDAGKIKGKKKKAGNGEGNDGELQAALAGTNRAYYFDCRTLGLEAPDLLIQVRDGALTVPKAIKKLAERKEAYSKSVLGGEDGEQEAEATEPVDGGAEDGEAAPVILDGEKNPVSDEFRPVFAVRHDVKLAVSALKSVALQVQAICGSKGGAHYEEQPLLTALKEVAKALADGQPHVVCPTCAGSGKQPGKPRTECHTCGGIGNLHKAGFKLYKKTVASDAAAGESEVPVPLGADEASPAEAGPEADAVVAPLFDDEAAPVVNADE